MTLQWAEVSLLLVTKRLVSRLRLQQDASTVTLDHVEAEAAAAATATCDNTTSEIASLQESCADMAARLTQLDPIHARFYAFVEQGGSVWGEQDVQRMVKPL